MNPIPLLTELSTLNQKLQITIEIFYSYQLLRLMNWDDYKRSNVGRSNENHKKYHSIPFSVCLMTCHHRRNGHLFHLSLH